MTFTETIKVVDEGTLRIVPRTARYSAAADIYSEPPDQAAKTAYLAQVKASSKKRAVWKSTEEQDNAEWTRKEKAKQRRVEKERTTLADLRRDVYWENSRLGID